MAQNEPVLRAAGLCYPRPPGTHPGNAGDLVTITRARLDDYFAEGMHTVILSHEDLYSLVKRGEPLAALTAQDGIEVQVIAFLRPFSEFMFGDYSQFMKQHFESFLKTRNPYDGRTFRQFCERRVATLTPARFLLNWQKRFPDRPLIVDSHRAIRSVMETLLGDAPALDWTVSRHDTNPSLRMEDCDRIVRAMRDPDRTDRDIRNMFRDAFHMTGQPDRGKTEARKNWVERAFAPQNAALLRHFGFDNRLPGYPQEQAS